MTRFSVIDASSDLGLRPPAPVAAAPESMVWASNWPRPSSAQGNPPDEAMLTGTPLEWMGAAETRHRILVDNPATLHGFNETVGKG